MEIAAKTAQTAYAVYVAGEEHAHAATQDCSIRVVRLSTAMVFALLPLETTPTTVMASQVVIRYLPSQSFQRSYCAVSD